MANQMPRFSVLDKIFNVLERFYVAIHNGVVVSTCGKEIFYITRRILLSWIEKKVPSNPVFLARYH